MCTSTDRAGAARIWVATAARTLKLASKYAEIVPDEVEAGERETLGNGRGVSELQGLNEIKIELRF